MDFALRRCCGVNSHLHKLLKLMMNRNFTAATMESLSRKVQNREAWRHYFKPNGIFYVS